MLRNTLCILTGVLALGCGSSSPAAEADTDAGPSVASSDSSAGSSTGFETETDSFETCRSFGPTTVSGRRITIDPDHIASAPHLVVQEDESLFVAGDGRILEYDANGTAVALHHTYGRVHGLARGASPGEVVALVQTAEQLQLTTYGPQAELDSHATVFESGRIPYGMPLTAAGTPTVLTRVRGTEEGSGLLQFRDATLNPQVELDDGWTLDTWAAQDASGRVFVGSIHTDTLTTVTRIAAYDSGAEQWVRTLPVVDERAVTDVHRLSVGPAVFLAAPTTAPPLRALHAHDGTTLWEAALSVAAMTVTPCGDVLALVPGDNRGDDDALYQLDSDGPHLVTRIPTTQQDHVGRAWVRSMAMAPSGSLFVGRTLDLDNGPYVANVTVY